MQNASRRGVLGGGAGLLLAAGMEPSRASGSAAASGLKKVCIAGVASALPPVKSSRPWDSDLTANSASTQSATSSGLVDAIAASSRRAVVVAKQALEKQPN